MSVQNSVKHSLKVARWYSRRFEASIKWGKKELSQAPIVFGNAMPKSGSHLIIQVLQGLTQIGPFVNPGFPPANRTEDNHKLSDGDILANLHKMRPGDIGYGYIGAEPYFIKTLTKNKRATIFVYRDPRDMIVSHIFYATKMHKNHWMHSYYTEKLNTMEERINAAIIGVTESGSELTPVQKRYDGYLGWLDEPSVLSMKFEYLILEREAALADILGYLEDKGFKPRVKRETAIQVLKASIAPQKSGTFRKGQPGNWREYFTTNNKILFKDITGDLLFRLGYEADSNW
jgi:hypothetical protein